MKANELRIGNYVYVDNELHHEHLKDIPMKVTSISEAESLKRGVWTHSIGVEHLKKLEGLENHDFEKLYESNRTYNQFIFFIKPIPLIEQWLLDFGFDKVGDRFSNWSFVIQQFDKTFFYGYIGGNIEIKTVSHLQNVYYFLTGNELNK